MSTVENIEVRDRDGEAKANGTMYIDKKRQAKESNIKGGLVSRKQNSMRKMTPPFDPQPHRVVSKAGSSVTVQYPSGAHYRRNSSHLKIFHKPKLPRDENKRKKVSLGEATAQTQPDSEVDTPHEESSAQMTRPDDKVDVTYAGDTAQDAVMQKEVSTNHIRLKTMPTRFKDECINLK